MMSYTNIAQTLSPQIIKSAIHTADEIIDQLIFDHAVGDISTADCKVKVAELILFKKEFEEILNRFNELS